ncbi:MAG: hypothetical protein JSV76_05210 [Candidatus Bathyarchaeota archaeon]|nr:MAG: hypothetical protein JSV76_05210 [Candidatus Bathyarchaeota archaeon]
MVWVIFHIKSDRPSDGDIGLIESKAAGIIGEMKACDNFLLREVSLRRAIRHFLLLKEAFVIDE